ncbi:MAG: molybdopterin-dependent oxidoreductase, partial [Deltaproteobacteria bacterium]|nr:molybdopterin-dependent oxidoreductase [Deltaproteobacteria bacterium]
RVRFPLKRVGKRGENKWKQVTWDQALDEIAEKLTALKAAYGPECLMATQGTARHTMWTGPRFMNLFGSPNTASQGTICYGPSTSTATAVLGWPVQYRADDQVPFDKNGKPIPKCLLFLGMTLSESHFRLWKTSRDAKRMGTKIIVIDPRRTRTTELADIWLQNRPGTDTALLMSMIHTIIEEDLYDWAFVDRWCHGFEQLAEHAKGYAPDKAEEITWVPAEKIKEAAVMYATNGPSKTQHGMGTEQLENCIEAIQARLILAAITGNIDVKGGDFVTGLPAGTSVPMDLAGLELPEKLPLEQKAKQIGDGRFKLLSHSGRELIWTYNKNMWAGNANLRAYAHYPLILRAILTGKPYPVRAGLTLFSNPLLTQANARLVYEALKSLDLYVVKDLFMTPSAQLADYVLPTAAWIERPNVEPFGGAFRIVAGEAALPAIVPGEHEYYTEYDFYRGLGTRLGQEKYWPWKSLEAFYDHALKPTGMSLRDFMDKADGLYWPEETYKKYEKMGGFATPTGKFELYSNIFEQLGYDPLPRFEEPKESPLSRPDLAGQYPLMLITGGRFRPFFHSEHRQIESLRKKYPYPKIQIHPETAQKYGVEDGDWVWIETPRGRIRQQCQCFDGIHPQVVHGEHGWWFPELPGEEPWLSGMWESNINILTDDDPERCNPRSGGWPLKTALCKVYKVKQY